ncbi:MAG: CehA/McbA family metallohydrolase [Candidatus Brocadiia bacterium]
MNRRRSAIIVLALALTLLSGCGSGQEEPAPQAPLQAYGVVELAGKTKAYRASTGPMLPGPGAAAQAGDCVLENSLGVFVVAGPDHIEEGCPAGNLIDAAFQRGPDYMRLLTPLLGPGEGVHPVYRDVRVQAEGGLDEQAVVAAEGFLPGRPGVRVVTEYTLRPGEERLTITTTVENNTDSMLGRFGFRDLLCHGRTFRYVPGPGLFPTGRESTSRWMAFFGERYCWGLGTEALTRIEGSHGPGSSLLEYATVDIPPGEKRSFTRRLMVGVGGPLAVWKTWEAQEGESTSRLTVCVTDGQSVDPVADATVQLAPEDGRPAIVMLTDEEGTAVAELPSGRYGVVVSKPGRSPLGPVSISCVADAAHRFPVTLSPATTLSVRLLGDSGEEATPVFGRLRLAEPGRNANPARGPAYPEWPWLPAVPVRPTEAARVPVGGSRARTLVGYRGPLNAIAGAPIPAADGRTVPLRATLQQVVDPGTYVAVDFRQHSDVSPDCALTLPERALLNACEGLDGAILSDPALQRIRETALPDGSGALMPAYRWERPGGGAFTFISPRQDDAMVGRFVEAASASTSAGDILETARQFFPDALLQVDMPLDPRSGVLALHGELPRQSFHMLDVLSGGEVESANRVMNHWFEVLNEGRRVVATGGSGSVGLHEPLAGQARTFVHCPEGDTPDAIRDAVAQLPRSPNAFVTNGPFLDVSLNEQPIGSTQTIPPGRVQMDVRVRAAPWVDVTWGRVYCNGELVKEFPVEPSRKVMRSERTFEFEVTEDCWFVVQVVGDRPLSPVYGGTEAPTPFALTNPMWVEVSDDEGT